MGGGTDSRVAASFAPRHPFVWVAATMIVSLLEGLGGHPRRALGNNPPLLVSSNAVPRPSRLLQFVPGRYRCAGLANVPLLGCGRRGSSAVWIVVWCFERVAVES